MSRLNLEWRQFRLLLRSGPGQLLDREMLAPDGDMMAGAANVLALLGSFGLALSLLMLYKYVFGAWHGFAIEDVTWPDKQYLIAAAMLSSGFILVLTWDGLFPDRRETMVVCPLPVHMRTLFAARLATMAGMLAAVVVAGNLAGFIAFPTFMMSAERPAIGWIAYAGIHATVIFAAAAFAFLALLALEGMLMVVLPYRLFRRVSAWVQLAILFLLLFVFVLEPNATPSLMADPANRTLLRLLPPAWFTALYAEMLGSTLGPVRELAALARYGTAIAAFAALLAYAAGYRKAVRKGLEESDALPAARGERTARLSGAVLDWIGGTGPGGAVFRFTTRTMLRHRRNRLILAVYLSLALGYTLGDVAELVRYGSRTLYTPSAGVAAVSLVIAFFTLLGMRVLFTIPVELRANWMFRVTEMGRVESYRAAARRVMLWTGAAPICAFTLPTHAVLWGWRDALLHTFFLLLVALLLIEILTHGFMKIPFACSFLPGAASLKTKLGVWAILFSASTLAVTHIEVRILHHPRGYAVVYTIGCTALALMRADRRRYERSEQGIVYEAKDDIVLKLGLQG